MLYPTSGPNVARCDLAVVPGYPSPDRTWVWDASLDVPATPEIRIGAASYPCTVVGRAVSCDLPDLGTSIGADWTMVDGGAPVLRGRITRWAGGGAVPSSVAVVTAPPAHVVVRTVVGSVAVTDAIADAVDGVEAMVSSVADDLADHDALTTTAHGGIVSTAGAQTIAGAKRFTAALTVGADVAPTGALDVRSVAAGTTVLAVHEAPGQTGRPIAVHDSAGQLTYSMDPSGTFRYLSVHGPAGTQRAFALRTGNHTARWLVAASSAAETGSDAGSDLNIYAYTDAGAYKGTPIAVSRATLATTFGGVALHPPGSAGVPSIAFATAPTYGLYASSGAVRVAVGGVETVAVSSGAVSVTGPASTFRQYTWQTNGALRWSAYVSGAETGSNVGSAWALARYDDAGVFLDNPIVVARANGDVALNGHLILGDGKTLLAGTGGVGNRIGNPTTKLGFFGTTPTTRPTGVPVTAAGVHAALVTLGLIAA